MHFIGNQHDPVFVAEASQRPQEVGGRNVEAALALDRLDDDRGDRFRIDVAVKQPIDVAERLFGRHAVVGVREFGMINLGGERAEAALIGHDFAGQTHRQKGAPVEAARECDDRRTFGVNARDLDRVLDRLGAGIQEDRLLGKVTRRRGVEPLGEVNIGLVGEHMKTGVRKQLALLGDGLHDAWMPVPGIEHGDAGREIDESPAIDVPNFRIFGLGDVDALGTDASRYGGRLAGFEIGRIRHVGPL